MCDVGYPKLGEPNPTMLGVLPLYHIYGGVSSSNSLSRFSTNTYFLGAAKLLQFPWVRGMPTVLMQKFDIIELCKNIEKYSITQCLVVPPICLALWRHPGMLYTSNLLQL